MTGTPATQTFVLRRWLFRLAWLLLAISLVIPAPPGSAVEGPFPFSCLYVYAKALAWSHAMPGTPGSLSFAAAAVGALAIYSHIAFLYTLYLHDDRGVSLAWKIILVVALAADASLALLIRELEQLPAYWVWLASIGTLAIGYVVVGGKSALEGTKARSAPSAIDRGDVPPFVWVLFGFTLFWIAVSAIDRTYPPADGDIAATREPLTGYVNDRAHVLSAGEASQLASTLQKFEADTPNQIAVAIYPRAPAGAIEEFTIAAAERLPLGRAGLDTGAILFVFMNERVARLEVGYGLEGTLTDAAAHRILESELVPAFASGAYFDGLDATLNAVFANVRDAYANDRMPGQLERWRRQLKPKAEGPTRFERLRRAASATGIAARIGIALLGAFIGLILWSAVPQWIPLARDVGRGVANLRAKRPFSQGMERVDASEIWDSLRLVVWTLGVILPTAGVIIIAGGGTFGGAGSWVRW